MKKLILLSVTAVTILQINAQNFTASHLPIVVINTGGQTIVDEPKITADMGIIYNGVNTTNNLNGSFNHYNGKIGIELRGQISLNFPQKSYGIELRDAAGNSVNKQLLGMPAESDWVLYAPYADKTLMRNLLAYTITRQMGNWASNCRYVEVMLNNSYIGVYVLIEKIKRGSGRVNIAKLNSTDVAGDALTGGYIFTIDKKKAGDEGWYSKFLPPLAAASQRIEFLYNYPKAAAIVSEQRTYLKLYVDSFETALSATNYQDTANGFRKYADANSFIDYLIVNEISRNIDAYRISAYFNKDKKSKGGKIMAGPVWDYDLAFGNVNYCNANFTTGWAYNFNSVCPTDYWVMPFWWGRLMQDTAFTASLRCRWKQLRQTSLSNQHVVTMVDSVVAIIGSAQQRQYQQWQVADNYASQISGLKNWLSQRLAWMDDNMPNSGVCADWPANVNGTIILNSFPNPFNKNLSVIVVSKTMQTVKLQITDAAGKVMYAQNIALVSGNNTVNNIAHAGWAAGLYHFYLHAANGETVTKKILKQ